MSRQEATIWGDIRFIFVIVAMFAVVIYILDRRGILPPLQFADYVILCGALLTLGISGMFNIYSSNGHAYHRLGFELCGMTLGVCLSLLTAQLVSGKEVLPRLGKMALDTELEPSKQVALVSILGFVSVVGLGLTAHIVRAIDAETKPPYPDGLSFISFAIGFFILFGYVSVLLGAGA